VSLRRAATAVRAAPLLLLLLLGAAAALPPAALPISREQLPWWAARHAEKLRQARSGTFDLVFLGDSITQQWEQPAYRAVWQRFYGDRHALNLGFIGDATSHLLWRIDHGELDGLHPRAVVILIGANNLGRLHWPASDDVRGIEAVVDAVRARLPEAGILLLGVLPSDRGPWVAETAARINRALSARYGGGAVPGVRFLDESHLFMLPDRRVNTALYRDGAQRPPAPALHPSPAGEASLAAAIEPTLARMLGDQPHGG
jgi:lysophospholipase L1-like esterase